MRLANVDERVMVARPGGGFVDLASASTGRFGPDPQSLYERWEEFFDWAESTGEWTDVGYEPPPESLGAARAAARGRCSRRRSTTASTPPRAGPMRPPCRRCSRSSRAAWRVRTRSSTSPPTASTGRRSWSWSSVAGRTGCRASEAWEHVAGVTAGQDISARGVQRTSPREPQFSLGKSFPGFGPTGPWLVSGDEFGDQDAQIECLVNGERVQHASTADMIFPVASLIEYISGITPMLPGDLLFTGTPAGVGAHRDPPRFLTDGDVVVTRIERIGELTQTFRSI